MGACGAQVTDEQRASWKAEWCRVVDHTSSPESKIRVFRSLFRGREDVYPRRFESRTTGDRVTRPPARTSGSAGCARSLASSAPNAPTGASCLSRTTSFAGTSPASTRMGSAFVAGVYPLLLDETCFFLAVDFDKANWQDDAAAFLDACRRLNVPAVLERSRSGRGGHVWFFFEDAIPAAMARRLGSYLLTETMERRPDVGLDSYDRLLPESGHAAAAAASAI